MDAAGKSVGTDYDRDGNVVATTDQENNRTVVTLDERAKPMEIRVPHANGVTRTTTFGYDQVGNRTTRTSRG